MKTLSDKTFGVYRRASNTSYVIYLLYLHARQPYTVFKILHAWHLFTVYCHCAFWCCVQAGMTPLTVSYYKYLHMPL